MSAHKVAYAAGSAAAKYAAIPANLSVAKVIVIHRHGDRAQISREIGPKFPETAETTGRWRKLMPSKSTMDAMARAARWPEPTADELPVPVSEYGPLYTGFDVSNYPYGQLTDLGSKQLIEVGRELKRRYSAVLFESPTGTTIPSTQASSLLLRSTNMCRTIQSLRSLLVGLFDLNDAGASGSEPVLPVSIRTRPKAKETLFPAADGPCVGMSTRRAELLEAFPMTTVLPDYNSYEGHIKQLLGYTEKVNWLAIHEILTCNAAHGFGFPSGVTGDDWARSTKLCGWLWGLQYKDDILNRLAIARFISEMLADLYSDPAMVCTSAALTTESLPSPSEEPHFNGHPTKMIIYSGHDSTLVPVMSALGLYDGKK